MSLSFLAALLLIGDQEVLLAGSLKHINVNLVIALIVTIWITTISTLVLFWAAGIKEANDKYQIPAPARAENTEDPENPDSEAE